MKEKFVIDHCEISHDTLVHGSFYHYNKNQSYVYCTQEWNSCHQNNVHVYTYAILFCEFLDEFTK